MKQQYHILNTRPLQQAHALTHLLENAGCMVFHLPVFEIMPVAFDPVAFDIKNHLAWDYTIFLSANAVSHYFQKANRMGRYVIAIGPATKLALEKHHVKNIIVPSRLTSEGILQIPALQNVHHQTIAIISGENPRSGLKKTLLARGAMVQSIHCYRRQPIAYPMDRVFGNLIQQNINCIISTSMESYRTLLALFQNPMHRAWLLQKTICVINAEMKKCADTDGFFNTILAEHATNEEIVRAIRNR